MDSSSPCSPRAASDTTPQPALIACERATAIALALFAIFLNISFMLHAGALWRDEITIVNLAAMPWRQCLDAARFDSSPPFFALLLKLWLHGVGASDSSIRLFGLVMELAILGCVWWAACIGRNGYPLISMVLLGYSPIVLRWVSLRSYGLCLAMLLVTMALIGKLAQSPRPRTAAAALLGALLCVHCVYQAALCITVACVVGALLAVRKRRWKDARPFILVAVVADLSLLVYTGTVSRQIDMNHLIESPISLTALCGNAVHAFAEPWPAMGLAWICTLFATVVCAAYGRQRYSRNSCDTGEFAIVSYWILTISGVIASWLTYLKLAGRIPQPWYFLLPMGVLAIGCETTIAKSLATRGGRWVRVAAVAVAACFIGPTDIKAAMVRATNLDIIAQNLNGTANRGDLIIVPYWVNGITWARYYHGSAAWTTVPPLPDHRIHRYDIIKQYMLNDAPMSTTVNAIGVALRGGHRVWLVGRPLFPSTAAAPPRLPRPPLPGTGWYSTPYEAQWSAQVGYYLENHAKNMREFPESYDFAVSDLEHERLLVVEGWRG